MDPSKRRLSTLPSCRMSRGSQSAGLRVLSLDLEPTPRTNRPCPRLATAHVGPTKRSEGWRTRGRGQTRGKGRDQRGGIHSTTGHQPNVMSSWPAPTQTASPVPMLLQKVRVTAVVEAATSLTAKEMPSSHPQRPPHVVNPPQRLPSSRRRASWAAHRVTALLLLHWARGLGWKRHHDHAKDDCDLCHMRKAPTCCRRFVCGARAKLRKIFVVLHACAKKLSSEGTIRSSRISSSLTSCGLKPCSLCRQYNAYQYLYTTFPLKRDR
jgi:hypothetical protein